MSARPACVHDDLPARAVYSEGAGIARVLPVAVAVPRNAVEAAEVVAWAAARGLSVIPRGSASGMAGGAVGDGLILDLTRLRQLHIDTAAAVAHAGAGVTRGVLDAAARPEGLWLPVDPSSGAFCTLAGMAATNAAGARSLRHGATRRWVEGLHCIFGDASVALVRRGQPLPDGVPALARFTAARSRLQTAATHLVFPPTRKDSSGYGWRDFARSGDLVDLLVGSEGTLAAFTEITLRLAPLPGASATLLVACPTLEDATRAAACARENGAAACELLDRTFLEFAAAAHTLPVDPAMEAVLLVELDAADSEALPALADTLGRRLRAAGAAAILPGLDTQRAEALWTLRHAVSPMLSRLPPTLQSMQFIEDCAVPPDALPAFVRALREALGRHGLRGVIFGHAGDAHVHVNPLIDITRADWRETVHALLEDVLELVIRFHGTLAGEHGDGRLRTPLLERVRDPAELLLARELKDIFDPDGRMNPGVKVPLPGQRAIAAVKYDPALPPLPAAARRALDKVAVARAYDRNRLELLNEGN